MKTTAFSTGYVIIPTKEMDIHKRTGARGRIQTFFVEEIQFYLLQMPKLERRVKSDCKKHKECSRVFQSAGNALDLGADYIVVSIYTKISSYSLMICALYSMDVMLQLKKISEKKKRMQMIVTITGYRIYRACRLFHSENR